MEGLLHPVGPEEAQTYWIRRAGAVLVLLVLTMGVGSMISNIGGGDAPVAAEPAPAGDAEPPAPADPAQVPAVDPSDEVVDEEAVPIPSKAEPAEPRPTAPPADTPAPEPQIPEATPQPVEPSQSATPSPASEDPLPPEPANTFHRTEQATRSGGDRDTAPCDPQAVRVTLDGPTKVQKGVPATYRIAVTNTADRDCEIQIDEKTFEFKVDSGVDRIWSSRDCVAGLPPTGAVLAPGRGMDWEMEWRAERSAPQCEPNPEAMGSGTYVATALLTGAKPAQLVMQLKA